MIGLRVITKCPYCHHITIEELGASTKYYDYNGNTVRITRHCGKPFITTDTNAEFIPPRYRIPPELKIWEDRIFDEILNENIDNITNADPEEYLLNKLRTDNSDVDEHEGDIRILIQLAMEAINPTNMHSEALTENMQNALVPKCYVCW